jgi:hypothetical protein
MLEVKFEKTAKLPKEPNCVYCHFKKGMSCNLFDGESLVGRETYGVEAGIGSTIIAIHPVRRCMAVRELFGGETPRTRASIDYPKHRKTRKGNK